MAFQRLISLVVYFSLSPVVLAQQDASATTTLKVNTKLTVVDVTVADKDGQPVHGLTQSDFVIKEDGKAQPIRNFDEYRNATAPAVAPGSADLAAGQIKASTGVTNIILLDDVVMGGVHADPQYMMYSKMEAQNFLKKLPSGTPVAVMESAEKLLLIQDVTTDRDILVAAINKVAFKAIPGVTLMPPLVHGHSAAEHDASFAGQARLTMAALNEIAVYAASIKGRKNLIWLNPGIPWLTNSALLGTKAGIPNADLRLQELYGKLTAARVAIYTIDSRGLEGSVSAANPGPGTDLSSAFIERSVRQESLKDFAEATGGKAYINRNDLDAAIGDAIANGSDYYSISYAPPLVGYDGKYHTIHVTVNKPGLHLQYRKGYTSLDLAKLNSSMPASAKAASSLPPDISKFRAGMGHGEATSTELPLEVHVVPTNTPPVAAPLPVKGELNPKVKSSPLVRYEVVYSIPGDQLSIVKGSDGSSSASVEFDVIAYGEDGMRVSVLRQTANVTLNSTAVTQFPNKPFRVPLQVDLPPGKLFLRLGALDVHSGRYGTLEVPQTVPKP